MTTTKMTKEQEEGFERYMECVRSLDEDQVSRLAVRKYGSVLESENNPRPQNNDLDLFLKKVIS